MIGLFGKSIRSIGHDNRTKILSTEISDNKMGIETCRIQA